MKALSIKQPWALYIAQGHKTIELRTWQTNYRGRFLIVSSLQPDKFVLKKFNETDKHGRHKVQDIDFKDQFHLHFGRAICTAELFKITPFKESMQDAAMCDYSPGLFAWHLRNIKPVRPAIIKGRLNFYEVNNKLITEL